MKWKVGINVKNSFKKALFMTAAAMTLSVSTFEGPVSVFAAENDDEIKMEDSQTLEQSPEDSQERIKKQNETREYFKNIPQKKLTVLILADKQYRDAHTDWKERTKELIEKGTKDFKEYYNIQYIPTKFVKWNSRGANYSDIIYNLEEDYVSYLQKKPQFAGSFSLIVGFTANKNYGSPYGGMLPRKVGVEGFEAIPLVTIKDVTNNNMSCSIESTIKHELSHTYSVPDDHKWLRNSVMSSKVDVTEWSSTEMEIIRKNRDRYQNHEI